MKFTFKNSYVFSTDDMIPGVVYSIEPFHYLDTGFIYTMIMKKLNIDRGIALLRHPSEGNKGLRYASGWGTRTLRDIQIIEEASPKDYIIPSGAKDWFK